MNFDQVEMVSSNGYLSSSPVTRWQPNDIVFDGQAMMRNASSQLIVDDVGQRIVQKAHHYLSCRWIEVEGAFGE